MAVANRYQRLLDKRYKIHGKFHTEALHLENNVSYINSWTDCGKKHNHKQFLDMAKFKDVIHDQELFELTRVRAKLTGRLVIDFGEDGRELGTCFVEQVTENSFLETVVTLSTALHVVTNEEEPVPGNMCQVELDDAESDEKQDKSMLLKGKKIYEVKENRDFCLLDCVTDNPTLINNLNEWIQQNYQLGSSLAEKYGNMKEADRDVIIVSYPHGYGKRISFGKVGDKGLIKEVRENQDCCDYTYHTVTCPGSSGASVYVQGKWKDGFGYWFGCPHVHRGAYDDFTGQSAEGVEAAYG